MARVMAWTIDLVLLEVFHFFLFAAFAGKLFHSAPAEPLLQLALAGLYVIAFCAGFLILHMTYFTLFHAWSGQTIGKMVMGLRVVVLDNKPVPLSTAFLRWSGYVLSFLPLATGFLWAAVDRDQCAWHDRLAQTRVIATEIT